MTKRGAPGILLVLSLVLAAGCGSTTRTLAQDLAWERWTQCSSQHSGMSLNRIDPDGRVWVTYGSADHRLSFNAWNECMQQAALQQGRAGATNIPPAAAVAPTGAPERIEAAPAWSVGDEWAYRYERPSGSGTFVWSVVRIESLAGQPHYVVKTGQREIFYRVSDFAFTQEVFEGAVVRASQPSQWRWIDFPLALGTAWQMKWTDVRAQDRRTDDFERRCAAEAREVVRVAAGSFETFRVECYNVRDGARIQTFWWAPAVRQFVRWEGEGTGGREVRELIGYKLR